MTGNVIGGVEIRHMTAQREEPLVVGGRFIDRWFLTLSYLTYDEFKALEQVARVALVDDVKRAVDGTPHTNGGMRVTFRLKEWPDGVFKQVYIRSFHHDRVRFQGKQGFDLSGRTLEMELEEA